MSYIVEAYLKLKDYKQAEESLAEAYNLVEQCKENEPNFPYERCMWLLGCYNIELNVLQKKLDEAEKYVLDFVSSRTNSTIYSPSSLPVVIDDGEI